MHHFICMALIASLTMLVLPSQGYAQSTDPAEVARKVEQLSSEGAQRYRARDFEGAIRYFEDAYALEPVPNLLYNIARCHEQLQNWDEAISYYELFIVAPDVESEARQHAMGQVQSLREIANRQASSSSTEPRETGAPGVSEPVPEAAPDRTAAYATLGTGVGILAVGGVFGFMASKSESAFHSAQTPEERLSARDSGQTQALIADVCFASGALVTLVGTYLFIKASPKEQAPTAVSWQPWLSPGGAGLGFSVGF